MAFAGEAPGLRAVTDRAERLGGMELCIEAPHGQGDSAVVAFAAFPDGRVSLSRTAQGLSVADTSLVAPTLFELLLAAGTDLGGRTARQSPRPPLRLPLDEDQVRRATRRVRVASLCGAIALAAGSALVVAVAVFLLRLAV